MSDGNLQHLQRVRTWLGAVTIASALAGAGCHGDIVTLGDHPPPTYHFGPPRLVAEIASTSGRTTNGTLTADLLEIYFSSSRDQDNIDVYTASRASRSDPFGAPQKVRGVNTSRTDSGSAISEDGLTLWLASDRRTMGGNGGQSNLDIWVTTRTSRTADWNDPVLVSSLNSPQFDIPRPPGAHGLTMPLGSERGGSVYRSFFATRASETAPFETPQPVPELTFENATTMDAFLSVNGLTIFYASEPVNSNGDSNLPASVDAAIANDSGTMSDAGDGGGLRTSADLFFGERAKEIDPFAGFRSIAELNTLFEERDPWMSEDKTQFFFSSDRGGNMNIYTSDVIFK